MVSPLLSWWTVTNVAGRNESSSSLENMGSTVAKPQVRKNAFSTICVTERPGVNGFHMGIVCTEGVVDLLHLQVNHAILSEIPKRSQ